MPGTGCGILIGDCHARCRYSVEDTAQICEGCHGEKGMPVRPEVPIIWGQNEGYLYIELRDYKSGLRKNELMNGIVADLTKDDIKALAHYFSQKPWPLTTYKASDTDIGTGQRVATAGLCTECHLGGFVGTSVTPRISGQSVTYLERQLLAFKRRERMNNPDMANLLSTYSGDDLKAMARYLGGIHVRR